MYSNHAKRVPKPVEERAVQVNDVEPEEAKKDNAVQVPTPNDTVIVEPAPPKVESPTKQEEVLTFGEKRLRRIKEEEEKYNVWATSYKVNFPSFTFAPQQMLIEEPKQ